MKNVIVAVVVLGVAGALAWSWLKPSYPTKLPFVDAQGETHSFADYQQRRIPVLAALVSDRDSFSPRTLELFRRLRSEVPEQRLAIIALHLDASDEALRAVAQSKGYAFTLVPITKTTGLLLDLAQTVKIRYAGDTVVVNARGRISKIIEVKDLTQDEFETRVRAAMKSVTAL